MCSRMPQRWQRIAADKAVKDAAFAHQISQPLWSGSFRSPVPFAPTDSFGTRRMFNGKLASIHRGTDFHAPSGTPVVAANDGVVIIAQGMFYEGNLVVIDHGQQFSHALHAPVQNRGEGGRSRSQRTTPWSQRGYRPGDRPASPPGSPLARQYVDAVMLLQMTLPTLA